MIAGMNADAGATNSLQEWIESLELEELRELLAGAASRSNEVYDWLDGMRVTGSQDPRDLLGLVNRALNPTYRFYDYRQANDYAAECDATVQLLVAASETAAPGLLPIIERAITLLTRAILKADDSSGMVGDLVHEMLAAHARAVRNSQPPLSAREQKRVVKWIVKYRYGGQQDFFDPDIVAYAPGLSEASIEQYREAIEAQDLGDYGKYPLTRLAVLSRDRNAIVAARGEPHNAMLAARLVDDLVEAGLHEDALHYARLGIEMDERGWSGKLIDFLVEDTLQRGQSSSEALTEAVRLRRDWFARFVGSGTFEALRATAEHAGVWADERAAAERLLEAHSAADFARYLLQSRPEEAWDYALAKVPLRVSEAPIEVPSGVPTWQQSTLTTMLRDRRRGTLDVQLWRELCKQREMVRPSDTLPVYRALIDEVLVVTAKQNYREAAGLLKHLRQVAAAVSDEASAEFERFLELTVERNKRRPNCIAAFKRAGLIR